MRTNPTRAANLARPGIPQVDVKNLRMGWCEYGAPANQPYLKNGFPSHLHVMLLMLQERVFVLSEKIGISVGYQEARMAGSCRLAATHKPLRKQLLSYCRPFSAKHRTYESGSVSALHVTALI